MLIGFWNGTSRFVGRYSFFSRHCKRSFQLFPLKRLADRVAMYIHAYTLYSAFRPLGSGFMLGSYSVTVHSSASGFHMAIGAVPLAKPGKLQKTETKGRGNLS